MILDLHRQGLSLCAIARQTGLDRKTVRRYIQRGLEPPAYRPRPSRTGKITAFQVYLSERVAAYPELTASRLHRVLQDVLLVRVKAPAQSKRPWDYYDVLSTIPGKDAFMGEAESGCALP